MSTGSQHNNEWRNTRRPERLYNEKIAFDRKKRITIRSSGRGTYPEKDTARVNLTESMEGKLKTGEFIEDIHELECRLQKIEDIWRLKEIEVVEVLRK